MRKFIQQAILFFGSGALVYSLLVAGCATAADRYNQTSPAENDCTLVLNGSLIGESITRITSFDGKPVDWKGDFGIPVGIWPGKSFHIRIPAGEHTLTGSTRAVSIHDDSVSIVNGPEIKTTFNFIAGHTYEAEISTASVLQFIEKNQQH